MKKISTPLDGAFRVELEKREDARGFFARFFCRKEFAQMGLDPEIMQINTSMSVAKGTLRGMHYQTEPKAETKVIRCLRGAIHDVIIDLRRDSPTFRQWYGCELTEENRSMLYVPRGFAHGFVTLEPRTEVIYLVSEYYSPECERGVRWNDPAFKIDWPVAPTVISDKDQQFPPFTVAA